MPNWTDFGILSVEMAAPVHILVMISTLQSANRRKLAGILRYARKHNNWEVRVSDTRGDRRAREQLRRWNPDAIIVCEANTFDRMLFRSDCPVVMFDAPSPRYTRLFRNSNFIQCDNRAISEAAAHHLLGAGFTSFAFLSPPSNVREEWSAPRGQFFKDAILRSGASFLGCLREPCFRKMSNLPRHTAIFAANDSVAQLAMSQCRAAGMRVPDDLAFVGVDNDEIICDNTEPPLSSVEPDFFHAGFLAANTISDMLEGSRTPRFLTYGAKRIVARESSRFPADVADPRVREAFDYIRRNALAPIAVPDVARTMHLSRRMAELSFRRGFNKSIAEVLRNVRIEKMKRLLSETTEPIEAICLKTPYSSVAHVKHLFKRMVGMTMREWRGLKRPNSCENLV